MQPLPALHSIPVLWDPRCGQHHRWRRSASFAAFLFECTLMMQMKCGGEVKILKGQHVLRVSCEPGAEWCMQIDDCVRSPTKDLPLTKFKLFGEQDSAPLLAESTDGINFTVRTGPCQLRRFDSFDPPPPAGCDGRTSALSRSQTAGMTRTRTSCSTRSPESGSGARPPAVCAIDRPMAHRRHRHLHCTVSGQFIAAMPGTCDAARPGTFGCSATSSRRLTISAGKMAVFRCHSLPLLWSFTTVYKTGCRCLQHCLELTVPHRSEFFRILPARCAGRPPLIF